MPDPIARLFATAPVRTLEPGASLFRADDPVTHVFQVRSGEVMLVRHAGSGTRMILHRVSAGGIVAEASAWSARYHCDAVAGGGARVATLPRPAFRAALAHDPGLAEHWAGELARAVQAARLRAEIRSLRTVAERLDAWLADGRTLPPRGAWQDLAAEIGVTREALYRALAGRRSERRSASPAQRDGSDSDSTSPRAG
ncbi:Crp/Fnr family transcriptional regulator [Salinarimonas rosea]|uniref:Crp/Fnr family transcriptional regulator n=1 Tax=Salinarimonas rosea TaxID=552063 RepID=UPI0003FCFEBD|nr:Crp/Fnr family transcriptional regulator [Salinarimonas rosea]